MENEWNGFLSEGMKSYKKAAMIMGAFFKNIQAKSQTILENRKEWGNFQPQETKAIRSTRYWDDYPYINAQIHGTLYGEPSIIEMAVNWYESKPDYPFYWIYINKPFGKFDEKVQKYCQNGKVRSYKNKYGHAGLILEPDPEDFDLERDFNFLLEEFVKTVL